VSGQKILSMKRPLLFSDSTDANDAANYLTAVDFAAVYQGTAHILRIRAMLGEVSVEEAAKRRTHCDEHDLPGHSLGSVIALNSLLRLDSPFRNQ